jgi:DNA (cytosine-5)-methyltransferase 1
MTVRAKTDFASSSSVAMKTRNQFSLFSPDRRERLERPRSHVERKLRTVGLFSGIGGFELGLHRAGHQSLLLCENEPGAVRVLQEHFPDIPLHLDVCRLDSLDASTELLVGGFPCQDLSQAGETAGIRGERSGLIDEVFRLVRAHEIPWLLLENVPFMLQLQRGRALDHIVTALEELGYAWAYRVVDSRSMGLPQRRERVYLLASKDGDPRDVLFADVVDAPEPASKEDWREVACGFYWTEGLRGLGWAHDAVPTLKAGSTVGIPSPPAIVFPDGRIVKPDIRDAERLQGFAPDWTLPAEEVTRKGHRWKLVGNAVTVDVARWLGERLREPGHYEPADDDVTPLHKGDSWPRTAWGKDGERYASAIGAWPFLRTPEPLGDFLEYPTTPLSAKATRGFYERTGRAKLRFPPGFRDVVYDHLLAVDPECAKSLPRRTETPPDECDDSVSATPLLSSSLDA